MSIVLLKYLFSRFCRCGSALAPTPGMQGGGSEVMVPHKLVNPWKSHGNLKKQLEDLGVPPLNGNLHSRFSFFDSLFFMFFPCVWVNYNDPTTTSLEIMVSKGNHPQMALIQIGELL